MAVPTAITSVFKSFTKFQIITNLKSKSKDAQAYHMIMISSYALYKIHRASWKYSNLFGLKGIIATGLEITVSVSHKFTQH
jgi:hypothetical protein